MTESNIFYLQIGYFLTNMYIKILQKQMMTPRIFLKRLILIWV